MEKMNGGGDACASARMAIEGVLVAMKAAHAIKFRCAGRLWLEELLRLGVATAALRVRRRILVEHQRTC